MATVAKESSAFGWLGAIDDGLRSVKAISLLLIPWPLFVLHVTIAGGITIWMATLWYLVLLVFLSAAGCVLSDVARAIPERSYADALITGAFGALTIFGASLLATILFSLWLLVVAIAFYICKLPYIGPILYAIVTPVAIVATGTLSVGMLAFSVLVPPAVWEGRGVADALRQFFQIITLRPVEVILNVSVLTLLFGFAFAFLFYAVFLGSVIVVPIGFGIVYGELANLNFSGSFGSLLERGGTANLAALLILVALLASALWAAALVAINGLYLQLAGGLELRKEHLGRARVQQGASGDDAWEKRKDQLVETVGMVQTRVKEAFHGAQARAQELAQRRSEAEDAGQTCQQCGSRVGASDTFCGGCGGRLEHPRLAAEGES